MCSTQEWKNPSAVLMHFPINGEKKGKCSEMKKLFEEF